MPLLVTLLPHPIARARLAKALQVERRDGVKHRVQHTDNWRELEALTASQTVHTAVVDVYDHGRLDLTGCVEFRRKFPNVPLLPYSDFTTDRISDVLALVRIGVPAVVVLGGNDGPSALRAILSEVSSLTVFGLVQRALQERVPAALMPVVNHLLENPNSASRTSDISKVLHCHPVSLRRRLRAAGLPPPEKLAIWIRLISAAHLLSDRSRSVESVAHSLDFPSVCGMRNQFRRYMGVSPSDLRNKDGAALGVEIFLNDHPPSA